MCYSSALHQATLSVHSCSYEDCVKTSALRHRILVPYVSVTFLFQAGARLNRNDYGQAA